MAIHFPDQLNTVFPLDSWNTKGWLQSLWHWMKQECDIAGTQLTDFTPSDIFYYPCDCTGGNFTITLPPCAGIRGKQYCFFRIQGGTNNIIIAAGAGETIDGAPSLVLFADSQTTWLVSDGISNWLPLALVINTPGSGTSLASAHLTAQSTAIGPNTLLTVGAKGFYRVNWQASITTAGSTSSVLGGTNGFQIQFVDQVDGLTKKDGASAPVKSAQNTTGTTISGVQMGYVKANSVLQYLFDYASVGATPMQYELNIAVDYLGAT